MCNCLLCHLGRTAEFENDIATLGRVIESTKSFDIKLSPHPISQKRVNRLREYLFENTPSGFVHFLEIVEILTDKIKEEDINE